jgi:hypothetical protein
VPPFFFFPSAPLVLYLEYVLDTIDICYLQMQVHMKCGVEATVSRELPWAIDSWPFALVALLGLVHIALGAGSVSVSTATADTASSVFGAQSK